jgi:hypothetical protein
MELTNPLYPVRLGVRGALPLYCHAMANKYRIVHVFKLYVPHISRLPSRRFLVKFIIEVLLSASLFFEVSRTSYSSREFYNLGSFCCEIAFN